MDFYGKRRIFYAISLALFIIGAIALIFNGGFVLDIQFQGGAVVEIAVPNDQFEIAEIEDEIENRLDKVVNVQKSFYNYDASQDNPNAANIVYKLDIRLQTEQKLTEDELNKIEEYLSGKYGTIVLDQPEYFEPEAPYTTRFVVNIPSSKINGEEAFKNEVAAVETDLKAALNKKVSTDFSYIYDPDSPQIRKDILNLKIPSSKVELTNDDIKAVKEIVSEKLDIVITENSASGDFNISNVSATVGRELMTNSLLAIVVSSVLILFYVWIRFRTISGLSAGVASVLALAHDAIVMIVVYAVFRYPVNETFVAAILTILGYSINDTIVIFDRIRENAARHKKLTPSELANLSIKESLTRSINTAFCVMISLVIMFVFAKIYKLSSIEEFSFPLIIGMISGCYSTIFISAPWWAARQHKKLGIKKVENNPEAAV